MGGSVESQQAFAEFDFDNNTAWKSYLNNICISDADEAAAITKLKRRWYKKNIDPDFDAAHAKTSAPAPECETAAAPKMSTGAPNVQTGAPAQSASQPAEDEDDSAPRRPANRSFRQIMMSMDGLALLLNISIICHAVVYFPASLLHPAHGYMCYRRALKSAIASYALGIFRVHFRHGLPRTKETFARALGDGSTQYLMVAAALLTTEAFLILVVVFVPAFLFTMQMIPSLMDALPSNGVFNGVLACVQFMNTTGVKSKLIEYASYAEIGLFVSLILGLLRRDFAALAIFVTFNFLRYRYIFSTMSRKQWRKIRDTLDALTSSSRCPAMMRSGYCKARDALAGWVIPTPQRAE